MSKSFVRIVAIILAAVIAGGVLVTAVVSLGARAYDGVPVTGDERSTLPIYLVIGAVAVLAIGLAAPMLMKKKGAEDADAEAEDMPEKKDK